MSVSREHRPAKTDRLDLGLLKRSYLGWLRGEKKHCSMVAVARYAGTTGAPDESGSQRRERGLAKPAPGREQGAGDARGRRALLQLAWRLLRHQPDSALVRWFRQRTRDRRGTTKKTMIPAFARTALARKLLIALWELATTGTVPHGVRLHATM